MRPSTNASRLFTGALYAAAVLAAILLAAWLFFPRYTFQVGRFGEQTVLYRCNRWTGQVTVAVRNFNTQEITWQTIKPEFVPPGPEETFTFEQAQAKP